MKIKILRNTLILGQFVGEGEVHDVLPREAKALFLLKKAEPVDDEEKEELREEIKADSESALVRPLSEGRKGGRRK